MTDRNRTAFGRKRKGRIIAGALLTVLAVFVIAMVINFNIYYHSVDVDDYLAGSETVTVEEFENGWCFHGENADTALIFYPGAKVEASAYAPLMYELAVSGIDCFLVRMPLRMAFFGLNTALDIVEGWDYGTWILSGHSLGGAMAASCAASNPGTFDGLLLLAAYSTQSLTEDDLWVLSLYGSEDQVLNMDNVISGREMMPEEYTEICIEGGNHAQFGSYGEQDGDGMAQISAQEQRGAVTAALLEQLGMMGQDTIHNDDLSG